MEGFLFNVTFIEKQADRYSGFAYLRPRTEKKVTEKLAGLNYPAYLPFANKAHLHQEFLRLHDVWPGQRLPRRFQ